MSPFPAEPINTASSGSISGTWTPPVDAAGPLGGNETSGLTESERVELVASLARYVNRDRALATFERILAARAVEAEQRVRAEIAATDLVALLTAQREWSSETFGPGPRLAGVVDHIRKELVEVEESHGDLTEWIDVVILALDGAWRTGASPAHIVKCLQQKYAKNRARTWPDWRTADPDKAIEHVPDQSDYLDRGCKVCGRDNRNGTHSALERVGHLSHEWEPTS